MSGPVLRRLDGDLAVMGPQKIMQNILGRFQRDITVLGAFADDLPVHLAFGRHVDDQVAAYLGLATQAVAASQRRATLAVTLLDLAGRRHVLRS